MARARPIENLLMILCGICISGFSVVVLGDVITRAIGHPWLLAQETMMAFFMYGIFTGVAAATAATIIFILRCSPNR